MLAELKGKGANWLASDKKLKKLVVSARYHLFRHRMWDRVLSLDTKNMFTQIYAHNLWNNEESLSGGGSTLNRTAKIRSGLRELVADLGIESICDAGCGDYNWMKTVDLGNTEYIGVDIVGDMIGTNKKNYEFGRVSFRELDIIRDELPGVDLILCREVLFHLSFKDVCAAIGNFRRSGSTYLLATHFPYIPENIDVPTGRCRAIHFQKPPLNFPPPIRTIEEDVSDHCLALWKIEDIDLERFWKK